MQIQRTQDIQSNLGKRTELEDIKPISNLTSRLKVKHRVVLGKDQQIDKWNRAQSPEQSIFMVI